jgi:hypothetical protein
VLGAVLVAAAAVGAPVAAHDGMPATVVVVPVEPAPGARVDVLGADFMPEVEVDVSVRTAAGSVPLLVARADAMGHFQRSTRLPLDLAAGSYAIVARATDGTQVERAMRIVDAVTPPAPAGPGLGSDPRLGVVLAFGAGATVLVLGLLIAWGVYHGAAARLSRARGALRIARSRDPNFARRRRGFRASDEPEPMALDRAIRGGGAPTADGTEQPTRR